MGITIDYRLSFEEHVSGLCKTAASQLSALKRLRPYIAFEKTHKTLVQLLPTCSCRILKRSKGLVLGPLVLGCILLLVWVGFWGDAYFGLFLLPFCLAFWGCVEPVFCLLLPFGSFFPFSAHPHLHIHGGGWAEGGVIVEGLFWCFCGVVGVVLAGFSNGAGHGPTDCF